MQLTAETIEKFKRESPELLESVTSGESEYVMKRDPVTDQCVKFDQGWCSIHRDYGDAFLGDACHFFPRITRALGETVITSAALSCPETARLTLYDAPLDFTERMEIRTPYSLRNYLPAEMGEVDALAIHQAFMALAGDEAYSPERNFMRVSAVAHAIQMQPITAWKDAVPLYIMLADSRILPTEPLATDLFHLLQALNGLVMASQASRAQLKGLIAAIADALGVTFDASGAMELADDASARAVKLLSVMRLQSGTLKSVLNRYVQAQLSQALFPFAGLGGALTERIAIMGVRFATVKLALATLGENPKPEDVVATVQTLARFMDHLADPTLSLKIYEETGWIREPRLRALLGDG